MEHKKEVHSRRVLSCLSCSLTQRGKAALMNNADTPIGGEISSAEVQAFTQTINLNINPNNHLIIHSLEREEDSYGNYY